VLCNSLKDSNALRNGSTGTNVVTSSHNFIFNNNVINASISSETYGTENYYSQNYQGGGSLSTAGTESFFNSTDVSSNLYVQDSNSGLLALVQGASTANGAAIVLGSASGLDNDKWALIPTDSGYYRITSKKSGLCMNVNGASLSAGALIIQYSFGSGKNDQWMPMSAGNGLYYFVNRLSGLCLDVPGGVTGTQLDQQPYTGGANQQFNLLLNVPGAVVQQPFFLSVSPNSQTVLAGQTNSFTITITTNSNFSGSVNLSVSGLPANTTSNFNPVSLSGNGNSILTIVTTTNTPVGIYALTITATGNSLTNTAPVNLIVNSGTVASPGTLVWTAGGSGINWSTALNWTNITTPGNGPPGTNNILIFTNTGAVNASALMADGSGVVVPANINNSVDTSFAVGGLFDYANAPGTIPNYHNIGIANGATLTVATNFQVGGFTQFLLGDNNTTKLTVSGAGGTLLVTNGSLTVSADAANGPTNNALLDLSGLDNFSMNGTQLRIGVEGGGSFHHSSGVIYLAKTNSLFLTTAGYSDGGAGSPDSGNPALTLGHNKSALGNGSQMYLGIANTIALDYATIGRGDANDLLKFNPAFLAQNPSVTIQGTNGANSRVGVYVVGDDSPGEAGSVFNTNDFSGGTVNLLANYLCVARGRDGANDTTTCNGFLTFDNGNINANTLAIGLLYPSGSNSVANGTVNVNGGTLSVISNLTMASRPNVGGSGSTSGILNVNGGTIFATNIVGGGGAATINLNSGKIDLQGGQISNVTALAIGDGISSAAQLIDGTIISSPNSVAIAANGTLAGNSTVITPSLVVSGTISPAANGIGQITVTANITFNSGGTFAVAVQNATGSSGSGFDFLQANGQLNIAATSANPFVIQLQSFDPNGSGEVTNFSADTNYDWTIATASGGIANFDMSKFTVDTTQFQNDLMGGYFYVRASGNSLILSFTNNHPPMATPYLLYQSPNGIAIPISNLASNWSDPDGDPVALADVDNMSTNGAAVNFDSHFIYYTNANNVADYFIYSVQDVRTNAPAIYRDGDTQRTATGEILFVLPPPISSIVASGNNFIFRGSNGIAGRQFYLLGSTNVALPLNQWQILATNSFDGNGNFNFTNSINTNSPQEFYMLQLQ
jgi:hypothetical protein